MKFSSQSLDERIERYWSRRAQGFGAVRRYELSSEKSRLWLCEIEPFLPSGPLQILDVGTGTGFFAILMTDLGHAVTGVDLSPAMIDSARETAQKKNMPIDFHVMNAAQLAFPSARFDVVLSRNLTWTLPDVRAAYTEWYRVLRRGGVLINFDADYGNVSFAQQTEKLNQPNAHAAIESALLKECDAIKAQLDISGVPRPEWDMRTLGEIGFTDIRCDTQISDRIYAEVDETFNPVPMFRLTAGKPG